MAKTTDTNEMQVGQEQSFDMPATGHIERSEFLDKFELVDTPVSSEKIKNLAFNEEMVEIVISEDGNRNAEQVIHVSNNGTNQFFFRNKAIWVRRKFVEILARARPESLSTPEYTDPMGNRATRIVKTHGLAYPFRVLNDKNPDGQRWLESILREA